MSIETKVRPARAAILAAACLGGWAMAAGSAVASEPTLPKEQFERATLLYFQQCAGCHGVLRKGATGKSLLPEDMQRLGQQRLERIIALGTEGGMNNFDKIYSAEDITLLATYIQMEPPVPPELSLAQMKESLKRHVALEDYPDQPLHDRNWANFFLAIERDNGSVAVIDGDKHELVARVPTGYAVHVMKGVENNKVVAHPDPAQIGRFWYTMGRDGRMTKIDLWQTPDKMLVAEVQVAYDARDVAVSGDGRYVIGGGYWPPHFVIVDGHSMEPLKVVSARGVNVDGEYVNESREAAIYDTPH
ncbi:MAG TPA: cytochrome D1 domain-containing protein, partial [Xanthomonadaceae bacterium]|nr:cytochrome D1 domain-containing protein [Xanthomonadaceae bacterium]